MTTPSVRGHTVLRAEITLGGVRYTSHYAIPARSWDIADEHMRQAFRDAARQQLAEHLAETLPITITTEMVTVPPAQP
ncbi:hypothetical protein [Streptomyces sp. NPDC005953]|uniref:hypothetical protein n=1 Tax=Streptomyces sp. NPDC005953 TaxID=3156719 RepID=UPI003401A09A